MAQTVKRLSTMWETWVRSLGQEDPLEKDMAIHSSTIAWKVPWTEEPGRRPRGSQSRTRLSAFTFTFTFKRLITYSHSVMSDSLQLHGLQHSRLPCPSQSPRVHYLALHKTSLPAPALRHYSKHPDFVRGLLFS